MAYIKHDEKERLSQVVERRVGVGPTEIVTGWQALLKDLLMRMKPFMRRGSLVTFQKLTGDEVAFFEQLNHDVSIPRSAAGFYLPPSVRSQMLGEYASEKNLFEQPDAGVVVASHLDVFDVIVNALFAFPPFTPAVDVYDRGQLTAGYQYATIDECRAELASLLGRHLGIPSPKT